MPNTSTLLVATTVAGMSGYSAAINVDLAKAQGTTETGVVGPGGQVMPRELYEEWIAERQEQNLRARQVAWVEANFKTDAPADITAAESVNKQPAEALSEARLHLWNFYKSSKRNEKTISGPQINKLVWFFRWRGEMPKPGQKVVDIPGALFVYMDGMDVYAFNLDRVSEAGETYSEDADGVTLKYKATYPYKDSAGNSKKKIFYMTIRLPRRSEGEKQSGFVDPTIYERECLTVKEIDRDDKGGATIKYDNDLNYELEDISTAFLWPLTYNCELDLKRAETPAPAASATAPNGPAPAASVIAPNGPEDQDGELERKTTHLDHSHVAESKAESRLWKLFSCCLSGQDTAESEHKNAHLEQSAGPSSAETVVDSTTGAVVPNKPEVSSQSAATTKSAGTTDIPESSTAQKSLTNRLRNWWSSLHFNWWGKGIRKKHNPTTQEAETTCFLKTS